MAFPIPANRDSGSQTGNNTDQVIDLTGIGTIASGDGILVLFGNDGGDALTVPSGWTKAADYEATGGSNVRVAVVYRTADGTEGTSVTFVTSGNESSKWRVLRFASADIADWSVDPPSVSAGATASNSNPDPPSHTVPWTAGEDNWWAALYVQDGSGGDATAYPSNTSSQFTDGTGGAESIGVGERFDTALDTWDPSTFTASRSDRWGALTVAVRPAAAAGTPEGTATTTVNATTSATGSRDSDGSGSHTVNAATSATGSRDSDGTGSQAIGVATSATGSRDSSGTASRTINVTTSAVGSAPSTISSGTATTVVNTATSATGSRDSDGTASHTSDVSSTATGSRDSDGTAANTVNVVVSAVGSAPSVGSANGTAAATVNVATSAVGSRDSDGSSTASVTSVVSAVGSRSSSGTGANTIGVVVTAVGVATLPTGVGGVTKAVANTVRHSARAKVRHTAVAQTG